MSQTIESVPTPQPVITEITKNSEASNHRVEGYRSDTSQTGVFYGGVDPVAQTPAKVDHEKVVRLSNLRYALRLKLAKLASVCDALVKAEDAIDQFNAYDEFAILLSDIWELREAREKSWRQIVNVLQAVIPSREYEDYTIKESETFRSIVNSYLRAGSVEPEDVAIVNGLLRSIGLDPWAPISARKDGE